ncbi:hypothetical protein OBBRIDRAFT_788947 [Obba rivulosa]|uniref:Homeobox domain-containing protein n=1 Tax=Obba rivulosa TaxID=1052685 RepID=A0A8E2DS74_9APHY|nr:hypothetical protein OBBRIDRAFT_788947 [Obba rivulosa]
MDVEDNSLAYISGTCKVDATAKVDHIPFIRKRLDKQQLHVLVTFFNQKSHPSKEERADLAIQLGLDLKTIGAWFQNRRRHDNRRTRTWNRDADAENRHPDPLLPRHPAKGSRGLHSRKPISLDGVMSGRERPSSKRPPLACKSRVRNRLTTEEGNLWDHIPSSPPAPPSSPSFELETLSAGPRAAMSLEWACAKARAGRRGTSASTLNEDLDVPEFKLNGIKPEAEDVVMEDGDFEGATGGNALGLQWNQIPEAPQKESQQALPEEDLEAAITLLGFTTRRKLTLQEMHAEGTYE